MNTIPLDAYGVIRQRLNSAGYEAVYLYPEYNLVGLHDPAVIVKLGRREFQATAGQRYHYIQQIELHCFLCRQPEHAIRVEEWVVRTMNALFKPDLTLGKTVANCDPVSIDYGYGVEEGVRDPDMIITIRTEIYDER